MAHTPSALSWPQPASLTINRMWGCHLVSLLYSFPDCISYTVLLCDWSTSTDVLTTGLQCSAYHLLWILMCGYWLDNYQHPAHNTWLLLIQATFSVAMLYSNIYIIIAVFILEHLFGTLPWFILQELYLTNSTCFNLCQDWLCFASILLTWFELCAVSSPWIFEMLSSHYQWHFHQVMCYLWWIYFDNISYDCTCD